MTQYKVGDKVEYRPIGGGQDNVAHTEGEIVEITGSGADARYNIKNAKTQKVTAYEAWIGVNAIQVETEKRLGLLMELESPLPDSTTVTQPEHTIVLEAENSELDTVVDLEPADRGDSVSSLKSIPLPIDTSPFTPVIHLSPYREPTSYITMSELGFDSVSCPGAEERAATTPFPLLTFEGVRRIREELFSDRVLSNHLFSDTLNPSTIRGCCPDAAPFTYQFWTHPEVKRRINEAAGLDLTIVFNYEIGHTNVQLGPRGWSGLKAEPDLPDTLGELASEKEIQPTLMRTPNWHKDSYPSSHLKGGRTVIRKPDGTHYFCELPPLGHAMVLQGGHIVHAVSPTDTTQERISMVTSYRPTNPLAKDISVLKTVRTMSDVQALHRQWCQYRLDVLSSRAQLLKEQLANPGFKGNVEGEIGKFMLEQGEFLAHTWGEMIKPLTSVRTTQLMESYLVWKEAMI